MGRMMGGWEGIAGGSWGVLGWFYSLLGLLIPVGLLGLLVLGGAYFQPPAIRTRML